LLDPIDVAMCCVCKDDGARASGRRGPLWYRVLAAIVPELLNFVIGVGE